MTSSTTGAITDVGHSGATAGFSEKLNTHWHKTALWIFLAIVIAHWGEHLFQAYQVYVLHWARPRSLGMLGLVYPWLVKSETMHYGYALIMLLGLWVLRKGFVGISHKWWMVSFWIQFWHHIEHGSLQIQAITGHYWAHASVPTSFLQVWIPRVELHLIYNTAVFVPMVIGMYYHMFPPKSQVERAKCTCAWHARGMPRVAAA
jgi:hypothetical protein